MHKLHIAAVFFCLIAITSCEVQEGERKNETSVESTTEIIKVVAKRHSIGGSVGSANPPAQDNSLGLGSVGIQIIGGLLQNMLSTNGINAQVVGSIINLFNPEKIRSDLLLIRRTFNLLARVGVILNKYLPNPPSSGYSFSPLDLLSSKVRFYTPETRGDVKWVAKNKLSKSKGLLKVPSRVQMMVDYVTQGPLVASTTERVESGIEMETNENVNEEIQKVVETPKQVDMSDENIGTEEKEINISTATSQKEKEINISTTTSQKEKEINISTTTSQNYPSKVNDSSNITITEANVLTQTPQKEYGLPTIDNKPKNITNVHELLLIENEVKPASVVEGSESSSKVDSNSTSGQPTKESSTTINPNESEVDSNKNQTAGKYDIPSSIINSESSTEESKQTKVTTEESVQVYDLLTGNNEKNKTNDIAEEYGLPSPSGSRANDIQRFEVYSLPPPIRIRPVVHQEYGVPERKYLGRRRLPLQHGGEAHFERGFFQANKKETNNNNFENIAEVPLDRNTIFDRKHGPLLDSFGYPVRN